jgi:putative hydrolase
MDSSRNRQIANKLGQAGDLLQLQGANPFRANAYRRAADTIAGLDRDLGEIVIEEGMKGLVALPNIGRGIAAAIHEILYTRRWSKLERLRGTLDPERLFQTVSGIGPELARRIHDTLDIDTLEGLETAAHDGRLQTVMGIGPRRAAAVRAILNNMLGRVFQPRLDPLEGPGVAELLEVDREYRLRSRAGELPTIVPRRFNPTNEAWLPILHTRQGEWNFTVLYSNTARAHDLGRTRDWVVVYFYDQDHREGQHTIVTETRGPLVGRRVVRGREFQCRAYYASPSKKKLRKSKKA